MPPTVTLTLELPFGIVNEKLSTPRGLEERLNMMITRNPRIAPNLKSTFQTGWKISSMLLDNTCAASLTQFMASLMYLQLHRINRNYKNAKPAKTYLTTHQNCTVDRLWTQFASPTLGHPNQIVQYIWSVTLFVKFEKLLKSQVGKHPCACMVITLFYYVLFTIHVPRQSTTNIENTIV